jgi:Uma2 family endonuclease
MANSTVVGSDWTHIRDFDSDSLYEVVNGQRREKPPMGAFASLVASVLVEQLGAFVRSKRLGVVASETLFRLGIDGPDRRPDIAFVNAERLRTAPPLADDPAAWAVVPSLAIEVVSPTNMAEDIQIKLNDYFRAGVQLVWVLFPRQRQVMIYESLQSARGIQQPGALDGGALLPGFAIDLAELFADPTRSSAS